MDVIYALIPGMLLVGLAAFAVLFWAARTGQYDDLEGDGQRILMDDDEDCGGPRAMPDGDGVKHPDAKQGPASGRPDES